MPLWPYLLTQSLSYFPPDLSCCPSPKSSTLSFTHSLLSLSSKIPLTRKGLVYLTSLVCPLPPNPLTMVFCLLLCIKDLDFHSILPLPPLAQAPASNPKTFHDPQCLISVTSLSLPSPESFYLQLRSSTIKRRRQNWAEAL